MLRATKHLRIKSTSQALPGYTAALQFLYPPTPEAQQALETDAALEIGDAILSKQDDAGPAAKKLERLLGEYQQIASETQAHARRVTELKAQQTTVANDESPDLAKRLLAVGRERADAEAVLQESRAALEALQPLVVEARQDSQRELADAARFQATVAVSVLSTRRLDVQAEILAFLSPRLSRLVALEKALVRARSGQDLSQFARIPELDLSADHELGADESGAAESVEPDADDEEAAEPGVDAGGES